jgi:hypothetical protein
MTRKALASSAAVLTALLASRAAMAQANYVPQGDTPQWLKDRQYNEGAGIKTGDFELHPGIAGEVGYDSNWFLRTDKTGNNLDNGAPNFPVVPALEFRVSPSLYIATLGPQRREGDQSAPPPSIRFRGGVNATYREFIGLGGNTTGQNDVSQQRNIGGAADLRLDILPERPWGGAIYGNYARAIQPNAANADPNLSFNRDDVGAGGEIVAQPGSGTLDWHFGYQFRDTIFEDGNNAGGFDNFTNEAYTRGRWKFRPRTALLYDATLRFINYVNPSSAATQGLVNSTPVRARIGLNGLITPRFAFLGLIGWGASFYDTTAAPEPQFDSVIGQAELKWFLAANPGADSPADLGLALSSISLGYTRDFQNSYLGNYYGSDRGYLKFAYFFAGRALITLEGGVGAVEYPNILWLPPVATGVRHTAFTDARVDATLFGEYRFTNELGVNTTFRYTANFSNALIPDDPANMTFFAMEWTRFEAFLGVRYFY